MIVIRFVAEIGRDKKVPRHPPHDFQHPPILDTPFFDLLFDHLEAPGSVRVLPTGAARELLRGYYEYKGKRRNERKRCDVSSHHLRLLICSW